MTKYKIVGILNISLGVLETIYAAFALIITLPKLNELYFELGAKRPSYTSTYLILGFILIIGLVNLFLGLKLFTKSEKREAYFIYALISLIASFFLGGIFSGIFTLSIIVPIYSLISQF
jgi:hypothetical protein